MKTKDEIKRIMEETAKTDFNYEPDNVKKILVEDWWQCIFKGNDYMCNNNSCDGFCDQCEQYHPVCEFL